MDISLLVEQNNNPPIIINKTIQSVVKFNAQDGVIRYRVVKLHFAFVYVIMFTINMCFPCYY